MTESGHVRTPGSAQLVTLVARREVTTRIRDKSFLISSLLMVVLILGYLAFQVISSSGTDTTRIGVVGASSEVSDGLRQQGDALGSDVQVVEVSDADELTSQVADGDVDAGLDLSGDQPRLLFDDADDDTVTAIVQGTLSAQSLQSQLDQAGVQLTAPPTAQVSTLQPADDDRDEQVAVAAVGVFLTYFLLILFGQFVAQGVVEEKSSRVVELLLATMKPWQLLAGKIIGLGLLGLLQIVVIAVVGVAGALAFGVFSVPGAAIGTVLSVLGWFVLGYALYASLFSAGASLVSRQEDLGSVLTPLTLLLVSGFIVAIQAVGDPRGTLATVTSFIPGISPLVMPVRAAAGAAPLWQIGVSVLLMLLAIALVVRLGGRIYAGALLRTGGKLKYREALAAGRS